MKLPHLRAQAWAVPAAICVLCAASHAATVADSYLEVSAVISVPDAAEEDTPFEVTVSGALIASFGPCGYLLYENAGWAYDADHRVVFISGMRIDGSGFNWGTSYSGTYELSRPAGVYTYTFVFSERSVGHDWYDLAVEASVDVEAAGGVVCGAEWLPPLGNSGRAGRTVPLKFTAYYCENGEFYRDEDIIVEVEDSSGTLVESWSSAPNPHTGVEIKDAARRYHINWDTRKSHSGDYRITVRFSSGGTLTRDMTIP